MTGPSLQRRIVAVFVGLLVLVMGLVLLVVHSSSASIVDGVTERELAIDAKVVGRVLDQNQRQLETAAGVLAADFAFREAIATQDQATVRSAIRNHGQRIHAQVMMVTGTDGRLIASTQREIVNESFPFPDLLATAESAGRSAGFRRMRNGQLYQVVLVPILAPTRIAWVAMGFLIDDRWAHDLSAVAGVDVHVLRTDGGAAPALLASSSDPAARAGLVPALMEGSSLVELAQRQYRTTRLPLADGIQAVLQLPVAQVAAPFDSLQWRLGFVVAAGVLVFVFGSVMLARHVVRPLRELSSGARRIADGDYGQGLPVRGRDEIGELARSFAHMRDEIANREERIVRLAYVDGLTGLPNRTRFLEAFSGAPDGGGGAVAVLDIDRFALINTALGYPVGDRLLQALGERLQTLVPPGGMLARLWGDHFAFLLPQADAARARAFADAVLALLRDPVTLDGQRLDIGGSLGIALYPQDGEGAGTLLRRAELAMAAAKRRHSSVAFVADTVAEPPHEQLSLIGDMRAAIAGGEFALAYQPKLDLASGRIVAAEALLRWRHPQRGNIPPARFIPFAEQTGFIREITPWVLETAIRQIAQWRDAGLDIAVSANLSTLDLLDPALPGHVATLLQRHGVASNRLCLEITESALMDDPDQALAHLDQLADLGVKLAIDDYGVGQASLAYLKSLPVDELKLDRSFVTGIDTAARNAAIVKSTIMLSHALGLSVVAEGVETGAEQAWLAAHGCDIAQGYGIARPMPAEDLPAWIAAHAAAAAVESTESKLPIS